MGRLAVIAVDIQVDFLPGGSKGSPGSDHILEPLKELIALPPVITVVSRRTKEAKIVHPFDRLADYIVTQRGISAFEGGTLRPLRDLELILKDHKIEEVIVGGYFLPGAVAQTAFDANALGLKTTVDLSICTLIEPSFDVVKKLQNAGVEVRTATLEN